MSTERRLRARARRRRCAVIGEDGTHARRRRLEHHADLRGALRDRSRPLRLLHHHKERRRRFLAHGPKRMKKYLWGRHSEDIRRLHLTAS